MFLLQFRGIIKSSRQQAPYSLYNGDGNNKAVVNSPEDFGRVLWLEVFRTFMCNSKVNVTTFMIKTRLVLFCFGLTPITPVFDCHEIFQVT